MNRKLLPLIFLTCVSATTVQDLTTANNLFTASLYKEVATSIKENLLLSPFSAQAVLALAKSGAKDDTAEEIRQVLHLPEGETKAAFKNLFHGLKSEEDYSLHTANKIYIGQNFDVKDEFKADAREFFLSDIENVDFGQSVKAANTINQWVENRTEHKIKNLVNSDALSSGIPALFINTLYFKAEWIDRDFQKYPSIKKSFHRTASQLVQANFMVKRGCLLNYYEDDDIGAHFVELPFKGGEAQMVVVLPKSKHGLATLETKAEKVLRPQNFKKEIIDLEMPMFKIENTIDFKKTLQKLGVRKAFNSGQADFSGIAGRKGDLAVAGILQKTFIDVNKDGVEAAAATDLYFEMSGPLRPKITLVLDHPFMFYIKVNEVILFVGKVTSPQQ